MTAPEALDAIADAALRYRPKPKSKATVRDWVSCNITLKRGLTGAKPEAFCAWIIDLLGAEPSDIFVDILPGTGAFGRAWEKFRATI